MPSLSHQATTPTDAVHSSSLSKTTAGTQAAPKPKVTPKQDELNKDVNIENEILVSLYRKRDLGQASESDRKVILTRQATLKQLKKELKEVIQNATRQKKPRHERKRKLESMDETTRKKLMGKSTSDLGRPEKCNKSELIKAICRIGISGSAAHDRRRNEVITAVKTLDQLTEALNREGFELKRSSVYLHLLPRNHRLTEGKRHVTTAPVKLYLVLSILLKMALMRFSWQEMLLAVAHSIVSSAGWLNSAKNGVVLSSNMIHLGVILMRRV